MQTTTPDETHGPAAAEAAIRRAIAENLDALRATVRKHGRGLVDVDEVLQRACARALERAETLMFPDKAAAWLGRIARHATMDALRRLSRDRTAPLQHDPAVDEAPSLNACRCVLTEARQLKPEYATILRRVVIEEQPVGEVARDLGLSPNNASVRLHRARAALRKRLLETCGTEATWACTDCTCSTHGCCSDPERADSGCGHAGQP